jgi:NAD(P)-dependent dehydrogenase (short-subunit alcohol dehydrogenase family)
MSWLQGRSIVVTGGTSGIGKAVGFALAERGGRPPDKGPDLHGVMRVRDVAPAVVFACDLPSRSGGATLRIL